MQPANDVVADAHHLADLASSYGWPDGQELRPGMKGFDAAVQAVAVARDVWGKAAAASLWATLGLPPPRPLVGTPARAVGPDDDISKHVSEFVEARMQLGGAFSVSAADIWSAYLAWCDEVDQPNVTHVMLGRRLGALGFRSRKDGGKIRYAGLRVSAI